MTAGGRVLTLTVARQPAAFSSCEAKKHETRAADMPEGDDDRKRMQDLEPRMRAVVGRVIDGRHQYLARENGRNRYGA